MATRKSPALVAAERRIKALEDQMVGFRKEVTEVTRDEIKQQGLDICEDGLAIWAERLGVESPAQSKTFSVTFHLTVEGTESAVSNLESEFEQALDSASDGVCREDGTVRWTTSWIEVEEGG